MTKTVEISGMDESRRRYGYEWGCQVLMFRALDWLKQHPQENPAFETFENIVGLMLPKNFAAKTMEDFAFDHKALRERGATGAMVQYSLMHAINRFRDGEEKYFASFADEPERLFDFDESDAFPERLALP